MRLLRKTGVRQPWQPAPLPSSTIAPLRPVVVVRGQQPVPDAQALMVGRLSRPQNVQWPARRAIVQVGGQPLPGALVQAFAHPFVTGAPPPDRLSPPLVITAPLPFPNALAWQLSPPRATNTDPLRPTVIAAAPPDATLARPNSAIVGRFPSLEDTQWPARPAAVQGVPVPVPSGSAWAPTPARDPNADPLRPPLLIAEPPDATLVQSVMALIGRLPRAEDVQWPARQSVVIVGAMPIPGASALTTYVASHNPAPIVLYPFARYVFSVLAQPNTSAAARTRAFTPAADVRGSQAARTRSFVATADTRTSKA